MGFTACVVKDTTSWRHPRSFFSKRLARKYDEMDRPFAKLGFDPFSG
jgi:hypothetical protein